MENTAPYYWKLPRRMGAAIAQAYSGEKQKPAIMAAAIQSVQREKDRLPVDASEAEINYAAHDLALEVFKYIAKYKDAALVLDAVALLCRRVNVPMPLGETEGERIARASDKGWWLRSLRKEHARRFEHVAIQLGFVSYKAGVYISNESAIRQRKRNAENQALLEKTKMKNELGQEMSLAELSAVGVSNKAIRRGELMTRIRGFEEIAKEVGDVGQFWTITAPSKFHAVLSKSGELNPNYKGATPRDAQAYLCKVWARIRAALKRLNIQPYGFRIAEPHHDGFPHWHMMLFVKPEQAATMEKIIRAHALAEDGQEKGAQENRVKLVNIDAGKGTAAGYIAKYVAKNIDGAHVGEHKTQDGWIVTTDLLGGEEIVPSARVTLWSQLHGIRQFQQIGGAPVSVWRELRRIKHDGVVSAPDVVMRSWRAAQRDGENLASFAEYIRAQGGADVGRVYRVRIAKRNTEVTGKYATTFKDKPCGVYDVSNPNAVYESIRYQWHKVDVCGVAVAFPWTSVNNCTEPKRTEPGAEFESWKKELWERVEKTKNFRFADNFDEMTRRRTYEH
jgi:hypothetical protein